MTRRNERAFEREASANVIGGDTTLLDEPPVKHTQHFMGRRDRKTACGRTDLPRISISTTDHRASVDCGTCLEILARRDARTTTKKALRKAGVTREDGIDFDFEMGMSEPIRGIR